MCPLVNKICTTLQSTQFIWDYPNQWLISSFKRHEKLQKPPLTPPVFCLFFILTSKFIWWVDLTDLMGQ